MAWLYDSLPSSQNGVVETTRFPFHVVMLASGSAPRSSKVRAIRTRAAAVRAFMKRTSRPSGVSPT